MTMTDYEKAKAQCWKAYQAKGDVYPTARETFDFAFEEAYRYGLWAGIEGEQPVSNPDKFGNSEQLNHIPTTEKMMRFEIAKAALNGILSNSTVSVNIAKRIMECGQELTPATISKAVAECALLYTDAFLAELDKTKEK